jgi:hypothetical protein
MTVKLALLVALETGSVTVIVAVPTATPVTTPLATVATVPLDDVHCRFGGVAIGLPLAFVADGSRVVVLPVTTEGDEGEICKISPEQPVPELGGVSDPRSVVAIVRTSARYGRSGYKYVLMYSCPLQSGRVFENKHPADDVRLNTPFPSVGANTAGNTR